MGCHNQSRWVLNRLWQETNSIASGIQLPDLAASLFSIGVCDKVVTPERMLGCHQCCMNVAVDMESLMAVESKTRRTVRRRLVNLNGREV